MSDLRERLAKALFDYETRNWNPRPDWGLTLAGGDASDYFLKAKAILPLIEQAAPSPCPKGHPAEFWKGHVHLSTCWADSGEGKPWTVCGQSGHCTRCAEITAAEQLAVAEAIAHAKQVVKDCILKDGDGWARLEHIIPALDTTTPADAKAQMERVIAEAVEDAGEPQYLRAGRIKQMVQEAVEDEREACAQECEYVIPTLNPGSEGFSAARRKVIIAWARTLLEHIAKRIRSRPSTDALELALARATKEAFEAALDCQSAMQAAQHPLYLAACAKLEGRGNEPA